ncbi:MAG: hypothetical protein LQ347_000164 [Umbilicaria vellea]|nr:MAG: hypothetical protein LQ347_000164 [Umbilicaria vellea]
MPKLPPAPLIFYPAHCFPLSPTFNAWAKVTATEVHALQEHQGFEGQNIFFHRNHPIKWIRVVGVIVALDVYPTRWILIIDDSSGETLEVMCPRLISTDHSTTIDTVAVAEDFRIDTKSNTLGITATGLSIDLAGVDVGSIVKVKGGIGEFRGVRQMTLEKISTLHTTNDEAHAWSELSHFRATILNHPWVVSHEEQRSSLEEADGTRRRKEERLLRKQERDHKIKANRKMSRMRKVEGKKGSALEDGKNAGERMQKQRQQRRVSNKENQAQADRLEGERAWVHEQG